MRQNTRISILMLAAISVTAVFGASRTQAVLAQSSPATQRPAPLVTTHDRQVAAVDPAHAGTSKDGKVTTPASTIAYVPRAQIADRFEIEAGKIAVQRAQRKEVKDFAQRMVDEHTRMALSFGEAVKAAKVKPGDASLDTDHLNLLEQLRTASISAFDGTYVAMQVMAHEKALKLHQGYAAAGDKTALKTAAQTAAPMVERHLQEARRISAAIGSPAS